MKKKDSTCCGCISFFFIVAFSVIILWVAVSTYFPAELQLAREVFDGIITMIAWGMYRLIEIGKT